MFSVRSGEPRTGVCGCDGPALWPAACMPDTRALPYPARLKDRFSVARTFQPEICRSAIGTPPNCPLEVRSVTHAVCLTRSREVKHTSSVFSVRSGEPRTGVCGCDGPALWPAACMPDTRALPYPARLRVRFSVARAFQPEICALVPGTPANCPLEVQSASNTNCLTRRREGKRTAQRSVAFAGDRVDGCLTRSLALQRMRDMRKRFE